MALRATTKRCRPSTFLSTLARHPPTSPAISCNATTFSYGDLARAVSSLLPHILSRVPATRASPPGALPRLAFLTPPTSVYVQTLLAAWAARCTAMPLSPLYPPRALEDLLRDADPHLLVTGHPYDPSRTRDGPLSGIAATAAVTSAASPLRMRELVVDVDGIPGADASHHSTPQTEIQTPHPALAAAASNLRSDHPAMLLYTSGTTGRPKGVVWTHAMVDYQVSMLAREWRWTRRDHVLNVLPLHHVHGIVNIVLTALFAGARCTMLDRFDPDAVWASFCQPQPEAPTVFMAVPTIYQRLIRRYQSADSNQQARWREAAARMRLFVCGSAPLPKADFDAWFHISGHRILERYGMTETGMLLSNPYHDRVPSSLGVPLPGVDVKVVPLDASGPDQGHQEPVSAVEGELCVRGPGVFPRYWERDLETKSAFDSDRYFRTGDMVVMDMHSRRIHMLGRASTDIIKTGGYKVSALEVEQVIADCPLVRIGSVVGVEDKDLGQRLACAVVLADAGELVGGVEGSPLCDATSRDATSRASLKSFLIARLPKYKVPRTIHFVRDADIPRNALGKVLKKDLSRFLANLDHDDASGFNHALSS